VKRRIIRFATRLYPAAWRERYAAELDALLEDMSLRWRDLGDVLGAALAIRMTAWSFLRLAFIGGLAGAIIAAGIALQLENKYISSAVVFVMPADKKTALGESLDQPLKPLEDVIQKMRQDGIQVAMLDSRPGWRKRFEVRYVNSNAAVVQKTVWDSVARLMEANLEVSQRSSKGLILQMLDPPSQPSAVSPNRMIITEIGIATGVLLAAALAIALRLFRRPANVGTN